MVKKGEPVEGCTERGNTVKVMSLENNLCSTLLNGSELGKTTFIKVKEKNVAVTDSNPQYQILLFPWEDDIPIKSSYSPKLCTLLFSLAFLWNTKTYLRVWSSCLKLHNGLTGAMWKAASLYVSMTSIGAKKLPTSRIRVLCAGVRVFSRTGQTVELISRTEHNSH